MRVLRYVLLALGAVGLPVLAGWLAWELGGPSSTIWLAVVIVPLVPYCVLGRFMTGAWRRGRPLPRWVWVAFWYTTVVLGAWFAVGYFGRLTTVSPKAGDDEPYTRLRLSEGDRVLAVIDWPAQKSATFRGGHNPLALKVEMLSPDGWVERIASVTGPEPVLQELRATTIEVFVDNRGRGPAAIECGQLPLPAAAGEVTSFRVLTPRGTVPVRIDGAEVGQARTPLVDVKGLSSSVRVAVIDTSGKRRYRVSGSDLPPQFVHSLDEAITRSDILRVE